MQIKKIKLNFKSGFATELESDTILWYIFALDFDNLKDIFQEFNNWNAPFLISNWFFEWYLPKPFYFNPKLKIWSNISLDNILENEPNRKINKNIKYFPIDKNIFDYFFQWDDFEKFKKLVDKFKSNIPSYKINSHFKNFTTRFNLWETTPYVLENINYFDENIVLYIKIYDENMRQKFYNSMQIIFNTVGFGKYKSIWYWKIKTILLEDLNDKEKELFDYIENMKKEWIYYILNNYLPTQEEIKTFDLNKSNLDIQNKNTKTTQKNIFKWNMNFVYPWSLIYTNEKLKWTYYKIENSFNFWYLF